ncbi:hypothetical protein CVS40_5219 [Lucilia cuprina]|nr:hypothetical protein CVS40_5219 [Lucilia cuprina]
MSSVSSCFNNSLTFFVAFHRIMCPCASFSYEISYSSFEVVIPPDISMTETSGDMMVPESSRTSKAQDKRGGVRMKGEMLTLVKGHADLKWVPTCVSPQMECPPSVSKRRRLQDTPRKNSHRDTLFYESDEKRKRNSE